DADHIAAISTLTSENRSMWRSCTIGMYWGVGHTTILLLVGLAVLFFKLTIPEDVARLFEAGVGAMLIGLGLSVGLTLWREQMHVHPHVHEDGENHLHLHAHRSEDHHRHLHRFRVEYKSLAIGMVHGLAGSAALLLMVVSAVHSFTQGVAYILLFGIGSIGGMVVLGAVVSLPFALTPASCVQATRALRALAGLASLGLGTGILYELA
ncbi:MAG: sulfite exporter TauE/SafE family protein, partial [Nitrospirota bacterium]|nr:sulfite exporter TauE/SafE family protein [Nitrospirota bacterium]